MTLVDPIQVILLLIAAILFGIAAFGGGTPKFGLVPAGLCLVAVALLLPGLGVH